MLSFKLYENLNFLKLSRSTTTQINNYLLVIRQTTEPFNKTNHKFTAIHNSS